MLIPPIPTTCVILTSLLECGILNRDFKQYTVYSIVEIKERYLCADILILALLIMNNKYMYCRVCQYIHVFTKINNAHKSHGC